MDKSNFFDDYFDNAELNSIMIMSDNGTILEVNRAFTNNFGYTTDDIKGKNFSLLFNDNDNSKNKSQVEIETTLKKGQANDDVFIVNKSGIEIWCSGETMLVNNASDKQYIVKDIINLQAKKQVNLFLNDTEELLERIFDASKDIPMMILDGSMKIQKVNNAFMDFFDIDNAPERNSSMSTLNHGFWNSTEIRSELSRSIVTNNQIKRKKFLYTNSKGEQKQILLDSKIIHGQPGTARKIFVIVENVSIDS